MSYKQERGHFIRTGRTGGWGSLLGDDGSGYALGREGVRVALDVADELNLNKGTGQSMRNIDPLVEKIFKHFDIDMRSGNPVDLLDRILTSDQGTQQDTSTMKKKITSVSRIILEEYSGNDKAKAIVLAGSESLVRILSLLIGNRQVDPSSSALILGGGLMQNKIYRGMVLESLSSSGQQFRHVQAVNEPAVNAARYLL